MYNMAVQVFAGRLRDAVHSCMSDQCKTLSTQGLVMLIRHARMICYSGPCPSTNLAKPCNTMVIWQDGSSIGCTLLIVWSSCNTLFSVNNLKRDSSAQTIDQQILMYQYVRCSWLCNSWLQCLFYTNIICHSCVHFVQY